MESNVSFEIMLKHTHTRVVFYEYVDAKRDKQQGGWGVSQSALQSRDTSCLHPDAMCIAELLEGKRLYVPITKFIMAAFEQGWIERKDVLNAYIECLAELAKVCKSSLYMHKVTVHTVTELKRRLLEQVELGYL